MPLNYSAECSTQMQWRFRLKSHGNVRPPTFSSWFVPAALNMTTPISRSVSSQGQGLIMTNVKINKLSLWKLARGCNLAPVYLFINSHCFILKWMNQRKKSLPFGSTDGEVVMVVVVVVLVVVVVWGGVSKCRQWAVCQMDAWNASDVLQDAMCSVGLLSPVGERRCFLTFFLAIFSNC